VEAAILTSQAIEKNGGDDGTRTRGLCRDSVAWIGLTTTYKNAGTAKIPASRTRHRNLWVGLWVGNLGLATKRADHLPFGLPNRGNKN
jgi:hypothetical protein